MALSFINSFVTTPSDLAVSAGSGIYSFGHRRVNRKGGKTEMAVSSGFYSLPATITPESYSDSTELLRDEILISDDFGASWRIVPRLTVQTGELTVSTFSSSWTLELDPTIDTQSTLPVELDFGEFSAVGSELLTLFLVNSTGSSSISSLTFSALDLVTGRLSQELADRLQISLAGVVSLSDPTGSLDISDANSFLYQYPDLSFNRLSVDLGEGEAAKLYLSLVNLPAGGFENNSIAFSLEVIPNQSVIALPQPNTWQAGTIRLDIAKGFTRNFIVGNGDDTFDVGKLALNVGGSALIVDTPITVLSASGSYPKILYATSSGNLLIAPIAEVPTSDNVYRIAQINNSLATVVTPLAPIDAANSASAADDFSTRYRFATLLGGVELENASATSVVAGVSQGSGKRYTYSGLAWLESGGSISAGAAVGSDGSGRAVSTATKKHAIALTGATASGQIILASVHLSLTDPGTGSGGGTGGSGTVTSVGLSLPTALFTVTGSPVTTTGTLTATLKTVSQKQVLVAPIGTSGTPLFRELQAGDIPQLSASNVVGGVFSESQIPFFGADKIVSGSFSEVFIDPLPASKIASGTFGIERIPTLTPEKMPAGSVIQQASYSVSSTFVTTNASYQASGIAATFTPKLSNSLIVVRFSVIVGLFNAASFGDVAIFKDGNNLQTGGLNQTLLRHNGLGNSAAPRYELVDRFTLSSGSSFTVELYLKRAGGLGTDNVKLGGRVGTNNNSPADTLLDQPTMITIQEIKV